VHAMTTRLRFVAEMAPLGSESHGEDISP